MFHNPKIKIGNWFDELQFLKESQEIYGEKRKKFDVLKEILLKTIRPSYLQEVSLQETESEFVKFGSCVQLRNPHTFTDPRPSCQPNVGSTDGLVVSVTVDKQHLINEGVSTRTKLEGLLDNSSITASPTSTPSARNVFVVKSADCHDRDGDNLRFGENFLLQVLPESASTSLYLRSEPFAIYNTRGPKGHNLVHLSKSKDGYCKWKALHWDKNQQVELEGAPFPPATRILLNHTMSGELLTLEPSDWCTTIFGNECRVSVHTYTDRLKGISNECIWSLATSSSISRT